MLIEYYMKNSFQVFRIKEDIYTSSDISPLLEKVEKYLKIWILKIALSFSAGSYFTYSSVSILIKCIEKVSDSGGIIALISPNKDVFNFIHNVGVSEIAEIYQAEDDLK